MNRRNTATPCAPATAAHLTCARHEQERAVRRRVDGTRDGIEERGPPSAYKGGGRYDGELWYGQLSAINSTGTRLLYHIQGGNKLTRLEFGRALEQRQAAAGTEEGALPLLEVQGAGHW